MYSPSRRLAAATKEFQAALLSSASKLLPKEEFDLLSNTSSPLAVRYEQYIDQQSNKTDVEHYEDQSLVRDDELELENHRSAQSPIPQLVPLTPLFNPGSLFSIDNNTFMPSYTEEEFESDEQEPEAAHQTASPTEESENRADHNPPSTHASSSGLFSLIATMQPSNSITSMTHAEKDELLAALCAENDRLKAKVNSVLDQAQATLESAALVQSNIKKDYDRRTALKDRENVSLKVENGTLRSMCDELKDAVAHERAQIQIATRMIRRLQSASRGLGLTKK